MFDNCELCGRDNRREGISLAKIKNLVGQDRLACNNCRTYISSLRDILRNNKKLPTQVLPPKEIVLTEEDKKILEGMKIEWTQRRVITKGT